MLYRVLGVAFLLAALWAPASHAQSVNLFCLNSLNKWVPASPSAPCPVSATVSASVAVAPLTSTNISGTVAVTNTFQSIQVSTAGRNGCLVQNNGTHTMWVYFGAIGSATEAAAYQLAAGLSVSCAVGGIGVLTDQVSITGTATDAFFANFQ
jgi:hypothetical protein